MFDCWAPKNKNLVFHCHERLANTKRGKRSERKWRKMEKNENEMLQMSSFLFIGRALALCFSIEWMIICSLFFLLLKRGTVIFFQHWLCTEQDIKWLCVECACTWQLISYETSDVKRDCCVGRSSRAECDSRVLHFSFMPSFVSLQKIYQKNNINLLILTFTR